MRARSGCIPDAHQDRIEIACASCHASAGSDQTVFFSSLPRTRESSAFSKEELDPRFRGGDEKKFGLIGHALPLRRPSLLLPGQEERDEESEVLSLARGAPFINRVPVASAPMIAGRIPTTAARRWL
jgi:hypothetical protein